MDNFNLSTHNQSKGFVIGETSQKNSGNLPSPKSPPQNKLEKSLDILKRQPSFDDLQAVLKNISLSPHLYGSLKIPSSLTSQFLTLLIHDILPNYWSQLLQCPPGDSTVLQIGLCLRSIPALSITLNRLKTLISEAGRDHRPNAVTFFHSHVKCIVGILQLILQPQDFLLNVYTDLEKSPATEAQKQLYWKEFSSTVATGKIISIIAEAGSIFNSDRQIAPYSWLGDGLQFSAWLAKNMAHLAAQCDAESPNRLRCCSSMFLKSMSLGYPDRVIAGFLHELFVLPGDGIATFSIILGNLRPYESKKVFKHMLSAIVSQIIPYPKQPGELQKPEYSQKVATVSAFLDKLISKNDSLAEFLLDALSKPEESAAWSSVAMVHSAILALAGDRARAGHLLAASFDRFSDMMYTKHAPILHQEVCVQILLLVAGVFHRTSPQQLVGQIKSSKYMKSISDHLASQSAQIRWLGMVVGSALSSLVDKEGLQLKIDDEDLSTSEAKWYLLLPSIIISPRKTLELSTLFSTRDFVQPGPNTTMEDPRLTGADIPGTLPNLEGGNSVKVPSKVNRIQILDDGDGLIQMQKPDSDPEDDDEDPTLVNREKIKPPVYIRQLLIGLKDLENYEKHQMALQSAASLIRRKSGFGKEVSDHLIELSTVLMSLGNNFDLENFVELRQEALIALFLGSPSIVGPVFAKAAFENEFSMQQRSSILTAVGLGSRELAGFKDIERDDVPKFASKILPKTLHDLYSDKGVTLRQISVRIQQELVEPLAVEAVEASSGPRAVQVRTISSRINKDKTRRRPQANELAKIVGDSLFFQLTGRWWIQLKVSGPRSALLYTNLSSVFIRTLGLVMHAAGPWATPLPQMTSEYWAILLSVQTDALSSRHYPLLESILFGILVIFEVNEIKERLAKEYAKELLETIDWAGIVLNTIGSGDEEGDKVRGLASAVIMQGQEIVRRWERLMVGDLINH